MKNILRKLLIVVAVFLMYIKFKLQKGQENLR